MVKSLHSGDPDVILSCLSVTDLQVPDVNIQCLTFKCFSAYILEQLMCAHVCLYNRMHWVHWGGSHVVGSNVDVPNS
jgi:hypothetical protein